LEFATLMSRTLRPGEIRGGWLPPDSGSQRKKPNPRARRPNRIGKTACFRLKVLGVPDRSFAPLSRFRYV